MPLTGTGGGGTHSSALSRLTLPLSARSSDGESSTRLIGPLRNASSSGAEKRACSSITFDPSKVITVSNGANVMIRSRIRNVSSPRTPKLPAGAERGVQQLGLDARHLDAPVAELVLVLHVEAVEGQRADVELARALGGRRVRRRRQVDDVVLVADDVDDAVVDGQVVDREAPAEHAPRQLHFNAAGDQERAVAMPLAPRGARRSA